MNTNLTTRRALLRGMVLASGAAVLAARSGWSAQAAATVEIWRSPACGCCHGWIEHLQAAGFAVSVHETDDVEPLRRAAGIPDELASCHTGRVESYLLEGHVPADAIKKLLAERPAIRGIAVPGMPQGSPGMALPGDTIEPFDVVAFAADGRSSTFMTFGR